MADLALIGLVVIGRNEGDRLVGCLKSVPPGVTRVVYVDSGSTDGSVEAATALGAHVLSLDLTQPFTAARARNAGFEAMLDQGPLEFVQFVDGDCEFSPGWFDTASRFLRASSSAAVACGRRRERFPDHSVYNRLCDWEWDTPIGRTRACGGDAMMRMTAVQQVGGFDPALIAGEEPELCVRLRQKGWEIWRLDHEMTLHDAQMSRFSQWWQRSRRAGHAFAEGAFMHGKPPEGHFATETRRALIWGAALPVGIILASLVVPWAAWAFLLYPMQILRLARRDGVMQRDSWEKAVFNTLGKFSEALGAIEFHINRLFGRRKGLIEYK